MYKKHIQKLNEKVYCDEIRIKELEYKYKYINEKYFQL